MTDSDTTKLHYCDVPDRIAPGGRSRVRCVCEIGHDHVEVDPEEAAVERIKAALLLEYPWHKYDSWGGEGQPDDGSVYWPHLQHVAEVAAHAALTSANAPVEPDRLKAE